MMNEDPFDEVLNLEDTFYAEGFKLGKADGKKDGLVEGRIFGLEKGFEKFLQMGKLHGRSVVWASRLTESSSPSNGEQSEDAYDSFMPMEKESSSDSSITIPIQDDPMPPLPEKARLEKHIRTLFALSEPESLSMQNNEDDVSEFDDRFKRAVAKAGIIGKLVGEDSGVSTSHQAGSMAPKVQSPNKNEEAGIEDVNILHARH